MHRLSVSLMLCLGLAAMAGCGSGGKGALPKEDDVANAKVEAMKRLAAALAKDPNGLDARGELENFRIIICDPSKSPAQAKQIADIYKQQIQSKIRGSVVDELAPEMTPFLNATKK